MTIIISDDQISIAYIMVIFILGRQNKTMLTTVFFGGRLLAENRVTVKDEQVVALGSTL